MITSQSAFALGANLPWIRYGLDFGANGWQPDGGLAATGIAPDAAVRIAELRERGVTVFRWFVFCDGRAGIRFSDSGEPLGLDERLLMDLDTALAFASGAGIQIVPTLFDFLWCAPRETVAGVETRGREAVFADARRRARLFDVILAPVLERFGRHPAVAAWDLINEPEWIRTVSRATMKTFLTDAATLVHRLASQPVTVGLASAQGIDLVRAADLDFYQVHWYDKFEKRWPLGRPVAQLRVDKPVVLGEFPTRGSQRRPEEILLLARDAGYAAAWFWSALADDPASDYTAAVEGLDRLANGMRE